MNRTNIETNLILSKIDSRAREALVANGAEVHFVRRKVLYEVGDPITHVYFLREGLASLIASGEDETLIEIAMVGREGVLGAILTLELATAPFRVVVPSRGTALCVKAGSFLTAFHQGGALQTLIMRYLGYLLTQITQSALCGPLHTLRSRLSRWLLICRHHLGADELPLTQEFLSEMLGVSRTAVSIVCGELAASGVIGQQRSRITVLRFRELEKLACPCYEAFKKGLTGLSVANGRRPQGNI